MAHTMHFNGLGLHPSRINGQTAVVQPGPEYSQNGRWCESRRSVIFKVEVVAMADLLVDPGFVAGPGTHRTGQTILWWCRAARTVPCPAVSVRCLKMPTKGGAHE